MTADDIVPLVRHQGQEVVVGFENDAFRRYFDDCHGARKRRQQRVFFSQGSAAVCQLFMRTFAVCHGLSFLSCAGLQ